MPPNSPDSPPICEEKKPKSPPKYAELDENNNAEKDIPIVDVERQIQVVDDSTQQWLILRKDIKWLNVIAITLLHLMALYGLLTVSYSQHKRTMTWAFVIVIFTGFGVTGGAHRLWTHRSYKANARMRVLLMICFITAGMNNLYHWVRDHRVHHKYSETDADPHNSRRGFFFSHVGWLMLKKHPDVKAKGQSIDMSDIVNDPVVAFCDRHNLLLRILTTLFTIGVPVYCWNEDWYHSFAFQLFRYVYDLNATWSVNSLAHIYGDKPYNRKIDPVENRLVSWLTFGEGWHNYHHTFPWDYRAAEIGGGRFNLTARVIEWFAGLGWASDLREPSPALVRRTIAHRGDGTHPCVLRQSSSTAGGGSSVADDVLDNLESAIGKSHFF
ncbi:unnamed protein product [Trichogramma brassicae]|uniref:Fatty acid desaturase domain-containing protein n=1 Tax=Trichogramma brassicae TaxID=86971 RepID=A0A6H5IZW5_9HYME|nr:unnamed protein product [Trichogramma brassicae]